VSEWTITIPASYRWLTANQRLHYRAKAELTASWRAHACLIAKLGHAPKDLTRVHIVATLRFRNGNRRDVHNWMPTLKACVDGLIDYGLLPDDSTAHLVGPDLRLGDKLPGGKWTDWGQIVLTIREEP